MKKHIFWIAPLVLFIILLIFDQGASYFNTFWFNVKHVVLFGLIVYVLLIDLYFVYRFFNKRYTTRKKLKVTIALLLCIFGISGTVLISNLQIRYIDLYETPQIKETTYYDRYGNVIYRSDLQESPELNITDNTNDRLSFTVEENYQGNIVNPYAVEGGVGQIYYQGEISLLTIVDITYQGPYVETLSYTVYETVTNTGATEPTSSGYINSTYIINDFSNDDAITITTERRILEIDLIEEDYPELDSIEPVITKHVGSVVFPDDDSGEIHITFDEITYDQSGEEKLERFANGHFNTSNESYIYVDFYEDGLFTGDSTNFDFSNGYIRIVNRQEVNRNSGLDLSYDQREVLFSGLPYQFEQEDNERNNIFMTDIKIFDSFTADLNHAWANSSDYNRRLIFNEIQGELFVNDSQGYYDRFIFTDYGLIAQEFEMKTFDFDEFFGRNEESEYEFMEDALFYNNDYTYYKVDVLDAYSYRQMITTPGGLSQFHFYQHNYLVEHYIIDNYLKFE